jgi:hypothetical protein
LHSPEAGFIKIWIGGMSFFLPCANSSLAFILSQNHIFFHLFNHSQFSFGNFPALLLPTPLTDNICFGGYFPE